MYLSRVNAFIKLGWLVILSLLAGVAPLWATWQWGTPSGGTTLKFLTVPLSTRSASLAGAGVASAQHGAEWFQNPIASNGVQNPELGISKLLMSDHIGASLTGVYAVYPPGNWRFSGGLVNLNYDDLDGRDEDGLLTGAYGAGAYAAQLGVSALSGPLGLGVTGRFASQNISGYHSRAVLCDAAAGFRLNSHVQFAATLTNLGWVEPYEGHAETAPLALQAGVTAQHPLQGGLQLALHSDLYRRADDSEFSVLLGGELLYRNLLTLGVGYPVRSSESGPSAGLGIQAGVVGVGYAYEANPELKGNHHIDLRLSF